MLVQQPVQANIKENMFKLHITGPSENPLNTWRNNNVVITSKRRHFDVITSKWRRFNVITTSLLRNVSAGNPLATRGLPLQKARNVANGNTIANQNRHMQKLLAIQPEMK